jgi:hypothetical protein
MADRDQGITYYPFIETQKKLIVNGSQILYQYWLAYTLSFRRTLSSFLLPNDDRYFFTLMNIGNEVYFRQLHEYYNDWLKYTDALFSERLRSDEFLGSLRSLEMNSDTGVQSSLSDREIKLYLDEALTEVKKVWGMKSDK